VFYSIIPQLCVSSIAFEGSAACNKPLAVGMEPTFDDHDALLEDAAGEDRRRWSGRQKTEEHFTPDPHADLPVYITIHRCALEHESCRGLVGANRS
jgi:hypothetical protein